ncbi:MAG: helix-turn-helix domain-containing protein [Chitinophagales bacterium]|jgi:excisionase family DNA binding protein|nr:helix-turn-helix domain-containing protein [Bacteroidota bacterium]MBK7566521.1 helix-turn-helix domain-containing protein [Bacteroidota bacterium]MBP8915839.1 helix-turn-helix domain-containing protein [Chitinophagales bacterium]MBP9220815.1 helix-turn-helix domain-containing protein [Chitinophagales bacterium]MBP9794576.1 helix-turn-helix domain-containing protein [Chitinophagales bacterium]
MEKTILLSLPVEDLQTLIIDCVNTCLKYNNLLQKEKGENDELLTVQSAAKFLSLSVPTIYTKISKGELPVIKRDKRCYFTKADLMSYLKEGRVQIDGSDFLIKKGK